MTEPELIKLFFDWDALQWWAVFSVGCDTSTVPVSFATAMELEWLIK